LEGPAGQLKHCSRICTTAASGFGLTLLIDGKVVTGLADSRAEWLRTMAGSGQPDDNAVVFLLREQFRGMADDEEANRWPQRQTQRIGEIRHDRPILTVLAVRAQPPDRDGVEALPAGVTVLPHSPT
jgi:hypothetical protein